jgi:hypothetical protein
MTCCALTAVAERNVMSGGKKKSDWASALCFRVVLQPSRRLIDCCLLRSSPLEIPDYPYNVSTKQTNK